jgi:hypothetical protein
MPGQPGNPTGIPIVWDAHGHPSNISQAPYEPALRAQEVAASDEGKILNESYAHAQAAAQNMPKLIAVAQIIPRMNTGSLGEMKQFLTANASALGITKDEIGSVNSTQTARALMLSKTAEITKEISPRGAQQIVGMAREATGSDPTSDPRHLMDIVGQSIAEGMSAVALHEGKAVPSALATKLPADWVNSKHVTMTVNMSGLPKEIQIEPAGNYTFVNKGMTTMRPYPEQAKAPPAKTYTDGTGAIYQNYGYTPPGK